MSAVHTACAWTGLFLVVAGSVIAGRSLYRTWGQHGDGPLFPGLQRRIQRTRGWLARYIPFLRKSATVHVDSAGFTISIGTPVSVSATVAIPDDASTDEKVSLLIRQIEYLRSDISNERTIRSEAIAATHEQIHGVQKSLAEAETRLKAMSRNVAVGELRMQLLALLLIALGTVLLAVPTLSPSP